MILTVVIPAYNVEEYLKECLNSFIGSIGKKEFEVLVINDGSTDRTAELAERFVCKYPSVFRLINKKNGGHGSAVNTGIRNARGRYIKVVDGDDWVDSKAFDLLLTLLSHCKSDIVAAPYAWVEHETRKMTIDPASVWYGQYGKEFSFSEVAQQIFLKMHALTYRTDLLRECGLELDEHCFYVDLEYDILPIAGVKTITFLQESVYMYRIGMSGQSMNLRNMRKNRKQYIRVLKRLLAYYEECQENKVSAENQSYIENGIALAYTSYFKILLSYSMNRKVWRYMKYMESWMEKKYPLIYHKVSNSAVRYLRKSQYQLYPVARMIFWIKMVNK